MPGLLFASFGTSYQTAREQQIDAVAAYLAQSLPGFTVRQAYTSNMVRRILEQRGQTVPTVKQALLNMAEQGIDEVVVQPGHLLPGEEYDKLCQQAAECRDRFAKLVVGAPLLTTTEDLHRVVAILDVQYPAEQGRCLVLMGHGTPQNANAVYAALDYRFKEIGRADVFVGTVEAYPSLPTLFNIIPATTYGKVLLAPLMQVAGDHACNDMAGEDEDSWASQFKAAGYAVESCLQGLGELPAVQQLYLEHTQAAWSAGA